MLFLFFDHLCCFVFVVVVVANRRLAPASKLRFKVLDFNSCFVFVVVVVLFFIIFFVLFLLLFLLQTGDRRMQASCGLSLHVRENDSW